MSGEFGSETLLEGIAGLEIHRLDVIQGSFCCSNHDSAVITNEMGVPESGFIEFANWYHFSHCTERAHVFPRRANLP